MRCIPLLFLASALPRAQAGSMTLAPLRDATLYAESGSTANGSGEGLFVGKNAVGQARRTLLHFDVAGAIPQGSTITSVTLTLRLSQTISGAHPLSVHRVSAGWSEGPSDPSGLEGAGAPAQAGDTTWVTRQFGAPGSDWATLGGDFVAAASATTAIDSALLNVVGPTHGLALDVQSWLDAPAQNFGWILVGDESIDTTAKRFDSRQTLSGVAPSLAIEFEPPCSGGVYCFSTANSTGVPAELALVGAPSIAAGGFSLRASHLPPGRLVTFVYAPLRAEEPLFNGVRCFGGTMKRLGTLTSDAGGNATRFVDLATVPAQEIDWYETWCFQAYYRDPAAGGAGANFTHGLAITFCP